MLQGCGCKSDDALIRFSIGCWHDMVYWRMMDARTHTKPFYGPLSGSTPVSRYKKKHSSTHTPPAHQPSLSASSIYREPWHHPCSFHIFGNLCTTSNDVLFGLPMGLEPSTSYSIHFFTQSLSSFCNTCPYHRNLFCCSNDVMPTIPSLSLNSLFKLYPSTSHHTSTWPFLSLSSEVSSHFLFLTGHVSLPCNILLRAQLLYSFPLLINDISLSLIHIWRCRRIERCRSRWSPYH